MNVRYFFLSLSPSFSRVLCLEHHKSLSASPLSLWKCRSLRESYFPKRCMEWLRRDTSNVLALLYIVRWNRRDYTHRTMVDDYRTSFHRHSFDATRRWFRTKGPLRARFVDIITITLSRRSAADRNNLSCDPRISWLLTRSEPLFRPIPSCRGVFGVPPDHGPRVRSYRLFARPAPNCELCTPQSSMPTPVFFFFPPSTI